VEESAAGEEGTLGDTKIICFPSNKKAENQEKPRLSALK
jgi:hypothetical protein